MSKSIIKSIKQTELSTIITTKSNVVKVITVFLPINDFLITNLLVLSSSTLFTFDIVYLFNYYLVILSLVVSIYIV